MHRSIVRPVLLIVLGVLVPFAPSRAQSTEILSVNGAVSGGEFGRAVTVLPNIDGLKSGDLAIGSPLLLSGEGLVSIVGGTTGTLQGAWSSRFSGALASSGEFNAIGLGSSLAGGSVDGLPVLLVGAPASTTGASATVTGGVEAVHLAPALTIPGVNAAGRFGESLAPVGDVNGDHFPDFIVGVPAFSTGVTHGKAQLISGKDGSTIRSHSGIGSGHVAFGWAVAGLGDCDGDGRPDYAVGDPFASFNGTDSGRVVVFSGANGSTIRSFDGTLGETLGHAVCGCGRVNFSTLVQGSAIACGAPFLSAAAGQSNSAGRVRVFDVLTGTLEHTLTGSNENGAQFGFSLAMGNASTGESGSGNDLLVGSPGRTVGGSTGAGEVRGFSLASGSLNLTVVNPSPATGARFGHAIAAGEPTLPFSVGFGRSFVVGAPGGTSTLGRIWYFNENGTALANRIADSVGEGFGRSVAFVGDRSGDGIADFAAGSPDFGAGGRVRIFRLAGATLVSVATVSGVAGEELGTAICGVGDPMSTRYNAFGLIMGGPGHQADLGRVRTTVAGEPVPVDLGLASPLSAGASIAALGDISGDGATDFAVGLPDRQQFVLGANGAVSVISGRTLDVLFTVTGASSGERLGSSVAGPGDVNGDGIRDFAAGGVGADSGLLFANAGVVRVYSGANGSLIRSTFGSAANEGLGGSLAGIGDANGDGIGDLAAGAPNVSVTPLGSQVGRVRLISGATGAVFRTINGGSAGEQFGSSLAATGDLDADGAGDLLVGAPFFNALLSGAVDAGRCLLISGATGASMASFIGGATDDRRGAALAAGDLDGDCLSELIFGSPGEGNGNVRAVTLFGLPAGVLGFGTGCPGSGGLVPVIETYGGVPSVGNGAFGLSLSCALGAATSHLVVGLSDTSWNGTPLPLPLDGIGWTGCVLRVSVDGLVSIGTLGSGPGGGFQQFDVPIGPQTALAGLSFYAQWFVIDPGAANGIVSSSRGLKVTIQ